MTAQLTHFPALAAHRRRQLREAAGPAVSPAELDGRRVVVVASSSRGCSSLLFSLLRSTGAFLTLPGEHTHLYKLAGVSVDVAPGTDDAACEVTASTIAAFREELAWTLGAEAGTATSVTTDAVRVAHALYGQWADLPGPETLVPIVESGLAATAGLPGTDARFLRLVADLRRHGVDIDPWYYDVDAACVRDVFPGLARPSGPPRLPTIVEEPPFVVPDLTATPLPRRSRALRPLLVKASVDAYRLDRLGEVFGRRPEIVHVTRNPAAAVCGLVDGWRSPHFYSHRLDGVDLAVDGYSDLAAGSGSWWNFDAPPGWEAHVGAPLAEVCAFQWRSAQAAILASDLHRGSRVLTVRAERLQDHRRRGWLRQLLADLAVPADAFDPTYNPVVVATAPPRSGRWREHAASILPALRDERVRDVSDALGYGREVSDAWV